ncbi:MAG: PTS glucose transporter subunit IIA [Propionibacteriaceae bacterium]|nr:PTS glucose transporter subunit IIA [Propionibacteriaceae bacterium]
MALGFGRKRVGLVAPFVGQVVSMQEVPDPVFSQRLLGDGYAVIPPAELPTATVAAPVSGTLTQVFDTRHAFVVEADSGLNVLVHIGLDTVELGGAGFEVLAQPGSRVLAGQPVIRMDLAGVRASGRNPITPVVFAEAAQVAEVRIVCGQVTKPTDTVCTVTLA